MRTHIRRDELVLIAFIAAFTCASVIASWLDAVPLTDPVTWQVLFSGLGVWKHAGFLFVQVLQVVVPFLPGQVTGVAAGYLFGTWLGTAYSMLGSVAGSLVAYWLARRYGRGALNRFVDASTVRRWDDRVASYGVPVFFAMLLLPGFPDDVLCFAAGLADMRLDAYIVSVVLGRLPLFALYAYAGHRPGRLWSAEGVGLAVALAVVSAVSFWYRERLFSWLTVWLGEA